jgi:hypothetical protein
VLPPIGLAQGVEIDPERRNLLDSDRRDDQRRGPSAAPPHAIAMRLALLAQAVLMSIGL